MSASYEDDLFSLADLQEISEFDEFDSETIDLETEGEEQGEN